ncbi:MAG: hypothetical protein RJA36_1480 [Pseudomonadota bacterium]|jgi:DNA polymerase-3 subunit epsilon
MFLLYKAATTGLPVWKAADDDASQPHIVELVAMLCNSTGDRVETLCLIVRPDGWEIPAQSTAIHGITEVEAKASPIDEQTALGRFLGMMVKAHTRVGWNEPFDSRIIRIALARYLPETVEGWGRQTAICAMRQTLDYLAETDPGTFHGRTLKLQAAWDHLYPSEPQDVTESTLDTVEACRRLFFATKLRGGER